jgi:hypothetical protein
MTTAYTNPFAPHPVRDLYHATHLGEGSGSPSPEERYVTADEDHANLVGSSCGVTELADEVTTWEECAEVLHLPVLDSDVPARLVPSETPGHHHLYFDVPMSWPTYAALITAMGDAGLLEPGYVSASLARRCTFVSPKPWKAERGTIAP